MSLDVVFLSRLQFALTIMFHYLFPPLTIGMGIVLVYLEAMFLWKREAVYEVAARFWTQIFAITFAVGVATGITMEFQFGTNWAAYSRFVGDVFGSALAAEGIFAFFMESGFLAVLVFGWDRVSPLFHFVATFLVAAGSIFSAIWIVVANSWMNTPTGHQLVPMLRDGRPWIVNGKPVMRAEVTDFWAMVFNPSTVDRLVHTLIGCFLMGAFFVLSISAFYLLKKRHTEFAQRSFSGALLLATFFSLAQLLSGHSNASMVAREQPVKLAAFEGHFRTGPATLHIFGVPDADARETKYSLGIPGFGSFLVHGDFDKPLLGLDKVPRADWPYLPIAFGSYHLMVAIGIFFIGLTLLASFFRLRKTIFKKRWLLWIFVFSVIPAVVANQAGWVAAESGRQPWVVYPPIVRDTDGTPLVNEQGLIRWQEHQGLRTRDAISESVRAPQVLSSIFLFGLIYLLLGGVWLFLLDGKIRKGPPAAAKTSKRLPLKALLVSRRKKWI